jgi:hypothetical protein
LSLLFEEVMCFLSTSTASVHGEYSDYATIFERAIAHQSWFRRFPRSSSPPAGNEKSCGENTGRMKRRGLPEEEELNYHRLFQHEKDCTLTAAD